MVDVWQSSVQDSGMTPRVALDGDPQTCTETIATDDYPFIALDFGVDFTVTSVNLKGTQYTGRSNVTRFQLEVLVQTMVCPVRLHWTHLSSALYPGFVCACLHIIPYRALVRATFNYKSP